MSIKKHEFYQLVADIQNSVSINSCGCMGTEWTIEMVRESVENSDCNLNYIVIPLLKYLEVSE